MLWLYHRAHHLREGDGFVALFFIYVLNDLVGSPCQCMNGHRIVIGEPQANGVIKLPPCRVKLGNLYSRHMDNDIKGYPNDWDFILILWLEAL